MSETIKQQAAQCKKDLVSMKKDVLALFESLVINSDQPAMGAASVVLLERTISENLKEGIEDPISFITAALAKCQLVEVFIALTEKHPDWDKKIYK